MEEPGSGDRPPELIGASLDRARTGHPHPVTTLAQGGDVGGVFLQYGALGCIALLALLAVRVLYNRAAEETNYHRGRADRLEDELRALNAAMREQLIQVIGPATEAIGDAIKLLESPPRRERQR